MDYAERLTQDSEPSSKPGQPLGPRCYGSRKIRVLATVILIGPSLTVLAVISRPGRVFVGSPDRLDTFFPLLLLLSDGRLGAGDWTDAWLGGVRAFGGFWPVEIMMPYLLLAGDRSALFATSTVVHAGLFLLALILAYVSARGLGLGYVGSALAANLFIFSLPSLILTGWYDFSLLSLGSIPVLMSFPFSRFQHSRLGWALFTAAGVVQFAVVPDLLTSAGIALFLLSIAAIRAVRSGMDRNCLALLAVAVTYMVTLVLYATQAITFIDSTTRSYGTSVESINQLRQTQAITGLNALRIFDFDIFGRFPQDAFALTNNTNLSENLWLGVGAPATIFLLAGLIRFKGQYFSWLRSNRPPYVLPYLLIVVLALCITLFPQVHFVAWKLFLESDFTYTRLGVLAAFPMALLVAVKFEDLQTRLEHNVPLRFVVFGLVFGTLATLVFVLITWGFSSQPGVALPIASDYIKRLDTGALARIIGLTGLTLLGLWLSTLGRSRPRVATCAVGGLIALLTLTPLMAWHSHTRNIESMPTPGRPVDTSLTWARVDQIPVPSPEQIDRLHKEVDPSMLNVVLCPKGVFCANLVGALWNIRTLDGYDSGLPRSLVDFTSLQPYISLRTLTFAEMDSLPSPLLRALGVQQALDYRSGDAWDTPRLEPLDGQRSTSDQYSTAFFAEEVVPNDESASVFETLAESKKDTNPPHLTAVVEGMTAETFSPSRSRVVSSQLGEWPLRLSFPPSPDDRLLVVRANLADVAGATGEETGRLQLFRVNGILTGIEVPRWETGVSVDLHKSTQHLWVWAAPLSNVVIIILALFILQPWTSKPVVARTK